MRFLRQVAAVLPLVCSIATAQIIGVDKTPSITMLPAELTSVRAGKPSEVELRFHVSQGFHVNSNTPNSEFLLPTVLKLDAPTDIVISGMRYPVGQEMSFPFAPNEKLSVYSGNFRIGIVVRPLHSVLPTKYMIHGQLRYQACDNAACYPPKNLPVKFEVKVAKAPPRPPRRNPAQSPHAHH